MNKMHISKILVVLSFFIICTNVSSHAVKPPVAINDFKVNSNNPAFEYLGKGFSELISFELRKTQDIKIIDREKRADLIKEQAFSLTGMVEPENQVKVGKMLTAQYMIFGEITDMAGVLLISAKMVDVGTGEVIWQDQITESGTNYPYISSYLARSILMHFDVDADKTTEKNIEDKKSGDEKAVIRLSKAVDAYDKKDYKTALKDFREAKKIDKSNVGSIAQVFINKLAGATAKFKIIPWHYVSLQNPAYYGDIKNDSFYFSGSGQNRDNEAAWKNDENGEGTNESIHANVLGFRIPLAGQFGIGFEWNNVKAAERMYFGKPIDLDEFASEADKLGETIARHNNIINIYIVTAGYKINDRFGVGAGVSYLAKEFDYGEQENYGEEYTKYNETSFGGEIGVFYKIPGGSLVLDTLIAFNRDKIHNMHIKDGVDRKFIEDNHGTDVEIVYYDHLRAPVYLENTVSYGFNNQKSFIVFKNIDKFYTDKSYYVIKGIPAVEHWLLNTGSFAFSMRGGLELSYINFSQTQAGVGFTVGTTIRLRIFGKLVDIDINQANRQRPSRLSEGTIYDEDVSFITISFNEIFKKE